MRTIEIIPALNGWIVQVGCEKILFIDSLLMIKEIKRYIDDPKAVKEEYLKSRVNKNRETGVIDAMAGRGSPPNGF